MTLVQANRSREIETQIYSLERDSGQPIVYHAQGTYSFDVETGEKTYSGGSTHDVARVVTFEVREDFKFEYDLSYIAANKNFTYGGLFVVGDRIFILRKQSFDVNRKDFIIFDGERYVFMKITRLDYDAGFILYARTTQQSKESHGN